MLRHMRRLNPQYRIELLDGRLVHVYPANGTAEPAGLLDLRLQEFFLPPDECMAQQMLKIDTSSARFSYTPELSTYLGEHKAAWYRAHGKDMGGVVGDFMGDCEPAHHRREPIYHNITVREALNLMAIPFAAGRPWRCAKHRSEVFQAKADVMEIQVPARS